MMTTIILAGILLICILSCKKNDDDGNLPNSCTHQSYTEAYKTELDAVTTAAQVYGTDPTDENCKAYKAAYLDYVNALEGWDHCASLAGQTAQWNLALDNARNAANEIMCD